MVKNNKEATLPIGLILISILLIIYNGILSFLSLFGAGYTFSTISGISNLLDLYNFLQYSLIFPVIVITSIFLLRKKKWAWILLIVVLSIQLITDMYAAFKDWNIENLAYYWRSILISMLFYFIVIGYLTLNKHVRNIYLKN